MSRRPRNPRWETWRRVRQLFQVGTFALFVYLLFAALEGRAAFPLADLFFRLDPLAALAAMLSSREWIPRLELALVTVGLTLAVGRVWCGWLCPLGSALDWLSWSRRRPKRAGLPGGWRSVKYLVLLAGLGAALFGTLTLFSFDPLSLLTRTMTTAVLPAFSYALNAVLAALYPVRPLRGVLNEVDQALRATVLPVHPAAYAQNVWIAAVLGGLIALNLLADRFWCRYLCPLGALLAAPSRLALLRPLIGPACNGCARCVSVCRMGAIDGQRSLQISPAECSVCLDCLAGCPEAGIGFGPAIRWRRVRLPASLPITRRVQGRTAGFTLTPNPSPRGRGEPWHVDFRRRSRRKSTGESLLPLLPLGEGGRGDEGTALPPPLNPRPERAPDGNGDAGGAGLPTRRQALLALAGGALSVALLRSGAAARTPDAQLIRPPGVADEADFLSRCLRCSQCMKVCPTAGLQPAGLEAGLEAVWTPRLVPRLGDCDYGCNACGQVCPSHAIPALELPAKRQAVLGVAVIDHDRCLPWAEGVPCIVCEEMCPTPRKAIRLEEVDVSDTQGQPVTVQRPIVMPDLCIGCGTCEYQCPRTGPAAIRVYRA